MKGSALLNLLIALLAIWVALAILGITVHGLTTLLWIAVVLFIATLVYYAVVSRGRGGPRI